MAADELRITVVGIKELRKALRDVDPELQKRLKVELKKAAQIVADDAKRRVPVRSGRAQGSIRAGSSGANAWVAGGKKTVPYYGWLEYGGRKPISGRPRSVGPWKGSGGGKEGRFIQPAIEAKFDEVRQAVDEAVDDAVKAAGF